ncbi:ABC transporter substrate-binding protein [bacterium]|nr:MAG: ABC transporter substrate-binding protein [bacterium]
MKKYFSRYFLAGVCVLAIFAAANAADTIKIGGIFSATGPASFIGEPEKNTAKMVEEAINAAGGINGAKIEFIIYDDETDATKAVTAFDRLVKMDKVAVIVGPSTTGNTLAVVPKAEEAGIPLVSCAAAKKITSPVKKWVFKTAPSDEPAVRKIYKHAQGSGISKLAIITASDGFGAAGREELLSIAKEMGIEIVADEVFGPKDTDMTAQLTKIKGTAAQAIVCWGTNPGPAVVTRNRVQLGIKTPLYMSHGVASKKFIELAGAESAEGVMLPAGRLIVEDQVAGDHPQKKVLSTYKKNYETNFKQEVSTFGGHVRDAVLLIAEAVKISGSTEPAAIRDGLEKVRKVYGTAGEFNLSAPDHNGLTDEAFVMVKITGGDWRMMK